MRDVKVRNFYAGECKVECGICLARCYFVLILQTFSMENVPTYSYLVQFDLLTALKYNFYIFRKIA